MTRVLAALVAATTAGLAVLLLAPTATAAVATARGAVDEPSEAAVVQAKRLVEHFTLARDRKRRDPVWAELVALAREYDDVKPVMTQGLVAFFNRANRRMNTRSARRAFADLVEARERLDVLRAQTLELVRDEVLYPYPYAQPAATLAEAQAYRKSQRQIDTNVVAMRLLWEDGSGAPLSRPLRNGGERVLWARSKVSWLRENMALTVVLEAPDVPAWMHSLPVEQKARKVTLQTFALTSEEAVQIAHDRAVIERNALLFKALRLATSGADARRRVELERDQVALTNDHRRLLGLSALGWNSRLHSAVRNHSDYLVRVGVLGHEQEERAFATIQRRAVSFHYAGPVWENCHRGSQTAGGALEAWTHSSAHHRTILLAKLTEMATGLTATTWVQKFGLDTAFESEIQCHPWRD